MGYEQQFVTTRKAVEAKIKPLNPSNDLTKAIDDDRAKGLATKLDQSTGKLYAEMDAAVNAFEGYRLTYFKKIDAQIARERDPNKLKPLFKPLSKLMESIVQQFEKLCDEKRKVELAEEAKKKALEAAVKGKTQGPPVKAAPGSGPIGGANTPPALKAALIQISNEFRKRGQKQLQVSIGVSNVCMGTRRQVGVLYETLQKELKTATDLSRKGMLQSAGRLKTEGQAQFNKAKTLTTDAAKHFNISLKPFARPHPLTAADVAKDLRINIPNNYRKDLDNITKMNLKIFVTAGNNTKAARQHLQECVQMVTGAGNLATALASIIDGKKV